MSRNTESNRRHQIRQRTLKAILRALEDISRNQGQDGYRHQLDQALHIFCALKHNSGVRLSLDHAWTPPLEAPKTLVQVFSQEKQ